MSQSAPTPLPTQVDLVLVDDTDPRIEYSGPWNITTGDGAAKDIFGDQGLNTNQLNGEVFNNSVHETRSNGSTATFRFNGTGYLVLARFALEHSENYRGRAIILLDGDEQSFYNFTVERNDSNLIGNTMELARGQTQPVREHELVLQFGDMAGVRFYLDFIIYVPSPGAAHDGDVVLISAGDPRLSLSAGWATDTNTSDFYTRNPGSSVTVSFNGTAIALWGTLNGTIANTAMYQLDKNTPAMFTLSANQPGSTVSTNQQLFNLSSLSPMEHKLVVTHNGTTDGIPLDIEGFIVTTLTAEEQASLSMPSPSPLPQPTVTASVHHSKAGIIGGTIGGLIALGILLFTVVVWTRKRRVYRASEKEALEPTPFVENPGPDFDPYDTAAIRHLDAIPSNPHKHSTNTRTESSPVPANPNDEMVNRLRFGNLKLQQRLAILDEALPQDRAREEDPEPVEHRLREPRIHTDSGWRMRQDYEVSAQHSGLPNYTEA